MFSKHLPTAYVAQREAHQISLFQFYETRLAPIVFVEKTFRMTTTNKIKLQAYGNHQTEDITKVLD